MIMNILYGTATLHNRYCDDGLHGRKTKYAREFLTNAGLRAKPAIYEEWTNYCYPDYEVILHFAQPLYADEKFPQDDDDLWALFGEDEYKERNKEAVPLLEKGVAMTLTITDEESFCSVIEKAFGKHTEIYAKEAQKVLLPLRQIEPGVLTEKIAKILELIFSYELPVYDNSALFVENAEEISDPDYKYDTAAHVFGFKPPLAILDGSNAGKTYKGIPIIHSKDLNKVKYSYVSIYEPIYYPKRQIDYLVECGIPRDKIHDSAENQRGAY